MNRRKRIRVLLRDCMAATSFASVAVTGSLPLWVTVAFTLGFICALFNRRLGNVWTAISGVLLFLLAISLFGSFWSNRLDLAVAAVTFVLFVKLQRLLSEPTSTTDKHVYLTSLLSIFGAAALSGHWFFGVILVLYIFLATVSMGLQILEEFGFPENAPLGLPIRRFLWGALAASLGAVAFFVFIPRLSWNFSPKALNATSSVSVLGLSDRIRLNSGNTIKLNPKVIARIQLSPDPKIENLESYFVARTFSLFSGTEWSGLAEARPATMIVKLSEDSKDVVTQRIEILSAYDSKALFALETPIQFLDAQIPSQTGWKPARLVRVPEEEIRIREDAPSLRYRAVSRLHFDAPRQAGGPQDADYFSLPESLNPQIPALAEKVLSGETDPLRAALALKKFLSQEFAHTLETGGEAQDPLSEFLFVRKSGNCQHFATALAILLRTQGFASRVVSGFFGGERVGDEYVLRAGDAHAWTQVWVPQRGFVTVDATPESKRSGQPSVFAAAWTRAMEWMEGAWRKRVIDYSMEDQWAWVRSFSTPSAVSSHNSTSGRMKAPGLIWLLLFLGALVGIAFVRRKALRPKHPATAFLKELEATLAHAEILPRPNESPEQMASRLESHSPALAQAFKKALRIYLEGRFGFRQLSKTDTRFAVTELRQAAKFSRSKVRGEAR